MTTITEQTETTAEATAEPTTGKPARAGARGAHVATKKSKSGKKATPAKKGKGAKESAKTAKGKSKPASGARDGSKTQQVLELLKRPGGVTAKDLMKATGCQPHSVRGFLSGTVRKKMGLAVTSTKGEDGERTCSIKS